MCLFLFSVLSQAKVDYVPLVRALVNYSQEECSPLWSKGIVFYDLLRTIHYIVQT